MRCSAKTRKPMTEYDEARVIDVLLVEDDEGDVLMTREAFEHYKIQNRLHVVSDGEQALQFLRREGQYADAPRPGLVLLDVNLPRRSGMEVLAELKQDDDLLTIPVIMLTTSQAEEDIVRSYALHANAFVSKPVDFEHFIEAIRQVQGDHGAPGLGLQTDGAGRARAGIGGGVQLARDGHGGSARTAVLRRRRDADADAPADQHDAGRRPHRDLPAPVLALPGGATVDELGDVRPAGLGVRGPRRGSGRGAHRLDSLEQGRHRRQLGQFGRAGLTA